MGLNQIEKEAAAVITSKQLEGKGQS